LPRLHGAFVLDEPPSRIEWSGQDSVTFLIFSVKKAAEAATVIGEDFSSAALPFESFQVRYFNRLG